MIKDGNYKFLDFEKHKEKFIDVFVEYYGKEHEDLIRERFDTITYIPYMNRRYVHDYFGKRLDLYRDEVLAEYCKITGRKHLTESMKKMIFSNGGSSFILGAQEGENLEFCEFLGDGRKQIQKVRKKVAKKFKMKGDPYPQIKREARNINQAIRNVQKNHPCEVFDDIENLIKNRNVITQMYLAYCNKFVLNVTDKDLELISKSTFDSYDRENLDCKWVLFGETIEEPGLASFFTTEAEERSQKSLEDFIEVYASRVSLFALNEGIESLQHVTSEELFGDLDDIADKQDFANRLADEITNYVKNNPEYYITTDQADIMEQARKNYVLNLYTSCKFARNLNATYGRSVHDVNADEQWVTHLEFDQDDPEKPRNNIFFDETQHMDVIRSQRNLIHEINHALGHGRAILDKDKKYAYSYTGLAGFLKKVYDEKYLGEYVAENESILQVEENFNERMSSEIAEIFEKKYGCVYEPSDIDLNLKDEGAWECAYDYYSFMTEKVWQKYKEQLKQHRISRSSEESTIFYDHDKRPPLEGKESRQSVRNYLWLKHAKPDKLINRGIINYELLQELGNLIVHFKENEMKELFKLEDFDASMLYKDDLSDVEGISQELATTLQAYKIVADDIFDKMEKEEMEIYRSKDIHDRLTDIKNIIISGKFKGLFSDIKRHMSVKKKEKTTADLEDDQIIRDLRKKVLKTVSKTKKEEQNTTEM